jgi:hypothetical protein
MRHTNILLTAAGLLLTIGICSKTVPAQTSLENAQQSTSAPRDAKTILRSARTIYVTSTSLLVGSEVVETKLRKRAEFQQLGLIITRDPEQADLVLELKHDVFTKYVYTAIDPYTSIVVASGKLSSLGGTVAGKVAKRFMKEMVKARS